MAELHTQCQFGERRDRTGRQVHPPTCRARASGIWKVTFKRGNYKIYFLCSNCAFHAMPNRVRMILPSELNPDQELKFFRDVERVDLIKTLGTKFNVADMIPLKGSKHWVEPKAQPPRSGPPVKRTIKVRKIKSLEPKMDLAKYINSLRRHDDGR